MGRSSGIPLRLAFATLAFALATSSPSLPFLPKPAAVHSAATPPPPKRLASDLLSLLGTSREASRIDPKEANRLRSCLRFLVPFCPPPNRQVQKPSCSSGGKWRRELLAEPRRIDEMEREIWWPPEPVLELSRIAVDSGGDPAALQRELDPTVLPVPDVEGLKTDRCQLTRTPYGRRFVNEELNSYLAFLFETIVSRGPSVGLNVSLSRYDLFHGHMFLASDTGRLGILFHAKEYPAYEKNVFPVNMGYCQRGSNIAYDHSINLRNILWLAPMPSKVTKAWMAPGVLVVLDAHPEGIIYKDLVPEYVDYVRTIYEDDFGDLVADVNYLNIGNVAPGERIFIC